ncbi:UNVERIFIED_CONTAM: atypical MEK-related kinase (incomplete catalytic triad) [Hammondia hammondi]|eukprot:XP_008884362.1 atypical MEK-related kinase (incomplete catalytic triad) [Hammondia hammondi]
MVEYPVRGELLIHASLHHRHICPLYGVVDDKERGECRLLLQLLPHALMVWSERSQAFHVLSTDDKRDRTRDTLRGEAAAGARLEISVYTEKAAREIIAQLLDAVDYLHSLGIAHKDIKPQNILAVSAPPAEWLVSLSLPPLSPSPFSDETISLDSQGDTEDEDLLFLEKASSRKVAVSPSFLTAANVAAGLVRPYDAYFAYRKAIRDSVSRSSFRGASGHQSTEMDSSPPSPSSSSSSGSCGRKRPSGAGCSLVAARLSFPTKRRSDGGSEGGLSSLAARGQEAFKRLSRRRRLASLASVVFRGEAEALSLCRKRSASAFSLHSCRQVSRLPPGEEKGGLGRERRERRERGETVGEQREGKKAESTEEARGASAVEKDKGDQGEEPSPQEKTTVSSDLSAYESFLNWHNTVDLDEESRTCVWKLVDFNSASVTEDTRLTIWDSEGTRLFTPPECLGVAQENGYDGRSRDMWSLGVCLYCLLLGRPPFFAGRDSGLALVATIMSAEVDFPVYRQLSEEVKNLIRGLLSKDPDKRLTSAQVRDHPWMKLRC